MRWKMVHCSKYEMNPRSLHLSSDLKYVVMGGEKGEKCVVLEIQ